MNIAIYGSGKFGQKLQKRLQECCDINIVCFIETIAEKKTVNGTINVDLKHFFSEYQKNTDLIIIAVMDFQARSAMINNLKEFEKDVYIARNELYDDETKINKNLFAYINIHDDRPFMPYLEIPIVEHCNLNCRNCGVVCNNMVPKQCMSVESFEKDIKRMSELCQNIFKIRIFGGEPLLHPQLDIILNIARKCFEKSDIRIVTNGLLFFKVQKKILDALIKNNIIVDISCYEPTMKMIDKIKNLLDENDILYNITHVKEFAKWLTLDDTHDEKISEKICWSKTCRYLKNGKISKCGVRVAMERLSNQFGVHFDIYENEDWFDIHNQNIDMVDVIEKLNRPTHICKYCTDKKVEVFPWQGSVLTPELNDYIIENE